jgi:hypothetical protein
MNATRLMLDFLLLLAPRTCRFRRTPPMACWTSFVSGHMLSEWVSGRHVTEIRDGVLPL